jgi:hypothetical protein
MIINLLLIFSDETAYSVVLREKKSSTCSIKASQPIICSHLELGDFFRMTEGDDTINLTIEDGGLVVLLIPSLNISQLEIFSTT